MKYILKRTDIAKTLKQMGQAVPDEMVFDRVWFGIESRINAPKKSFWNHWIWKPWGHPVRWIAFAACFCAAVTGGFYYQNRVDRIDNDEVASYLVNISDPMGTISRDQNIVKVSALLSDPAPSMPDMSDEVHIDSLASDEIFL